MVTANLRRATNTSNNSPEVDLAVVNQSTNNVAILLGAVDTNGNISFTEAPNSPVAVGQLPVAIATSDLNADGIPDFAVVNRSDDTASILLGSSNEDGPFSPASGSPLPTATTPAGITIGHLPRGTGP